MNHAPHNNECPVDALLLLAARADCAESGLSLRGRRFRPRYDLPTPSPLRSVGSFSLAGVSICGLKTLTRCPFPLLRPKHKSHR
jgi:hypothetical protein